MSILTAGLAFLGGVVLATLLQVVLQDLVYNVLSRLIPGSLHSPRRKLNGNWESVYEYKSQRARAVGRQTMRLQQVGPYVFGRWIAGTGAHRHRIRGRIRDVYLTGTWENVAPGAVHHGAFQLIVSPDGEEMHGKWVGFDGEHHLQHGDWTWTLQSR